jgi:hypothetical protein
MSCTLKIDLSEHWAGLRAPCAYGPSFLASPCRARASLCWELRYHGSSDPLPSLPSAVEAREAVENPSPFPEAQQSNTRDTMYRVGPLASFSSLFHMRGTGSIYRDAIALRAIFGICPHNPSLGFLNTLHHRHGCMRCSVCGDPSSPMVMDWWFLLWARGKEAGRRAESPFYDTKACLTQVVPGFVLNRSIEPLSFLGLGVH